MYMWRVASMDWRGLLWRWVIQTFATLIRQKPTHLWCILFRSCSWPSQTSLWWVDKILLYFKIGHFRDWGFFSKMCMACVTKFSAKKSWIMLFSFPFTPLQVLPIFSSRKLGHTAVSAVFVMSGITSVLYHLSDTSAYSFWWVQMATTTGVLILPDQDVVLDLATGWLLPGSICNGYYHYCCDGGGTLAYRNCVNTIYALFEHVFLPFNSLYHMIWYICIVSIDIHWAFLERHFLLWISSYV